MVDTDGLEYEDLISNEPAPAQQDTHSGFVVDSDSKAEWCIHKIMEIQAETVRWKNFYMEQMKAVEDSNMFRIARIKTLLIPYMQKVPLKETKTKRKYSLPSGDLVIKREHTRIEHDDSALLDWLHGMPEGRLYIKNKESVDWKALKPYLVEKDGAYYFMETGEAVPSVRNVFVPSEFVVSPKGSDEP